MLVCQGSCNFRNKGSYLPGSLQVNGGKLIIRGMIIRMGAGGDKEYRNVLGIERCMIGGAKAFVGEFQVKTIITVNGFQQVLEAG